MNSLLIAGLVGLNLIGFYADYRTSVMVQTQPGGYERSKAVRALIRMFGLKMGLIVAKLCVDVPASVVLALLAPAFLPVIFVFHALIAVKNYRVYRAHKPI